MSEQVPRGSVRLGWLFLVGCVIEGAAIVAIFQGRSAAATISLAFVGGACLIASVLISRFQEGILQAGAGGFRVQWRRQLTEQIAEVLTDELEDEGVSQAASFTDLGGLSLPFASSVQLADVNNDGEQELIVQSPVGAHSTRLRVFGWGGPSMEPEFGQIYEKVSNLGTPFIIGDLDGDGQTELATLDTDWSKDGANNASGPFLELLYRWDGSSFAEVGRREIGSELTDVTFEWFKPKSD